MDLGDGDFVRVLLGYGRGFPVKAGFYYGEEGFAIKNFGENLIYAAHQKICKNEKILLDRIVVAYIRLDILLYGFGP